MDLTQLQPLPPLLLVRELPFSTTSTIPTLLLLCVKILSIRLTPPVPTLYSPRVERDEVVVQKQVADTRMKNGIIRNIFWRHQNNRRAEKIHVEVEEDCDDDDGKDISACFVFAN